MSLKASPTMTRGWQLNRAKRQPTADEARRVSGIPMRPPVFSSVKKKSSLGIYPDIISLIVAALLKEISIFLEPEKFAAFPKKGIFSVRG